MPCVFYSLAVLFTLMYWQQLNSHSALQGLTVLAASINCDAEQVESTMMPLHRGDKTPDLDLHNNKHVYLPF